MTRISSAAFFTVLLLAGSAGDLAAQDEHRAKAFAAYEAGDVARAADLLYRLYKAGAHDQELLSTGAAALEKAGRFNDALDVLSRGAKKFPKEAAFRVGLARIYNLKAATTFRDSGKMDQHVALPYQDSVREAQRVLRKWPKNRDARLILANSLYSLGEWDKTKQQAEELIRRFPKHAGGYIVMGDLAFMHFKLLRKRTTGADADTSEQTLNKIVGAREAARKNYQTAVDVDPKRVVAHTKLGDVYAWNGQVKEALRHYQNALRVNPTAPVSHGWITKNTKPEERYRMYEKLGAEYAAQPDADPKKTAVFMWYGAAALRDAKQYQLSEELYIASVKLNPAYLSAYYYAMYSAYFYRKDEKQAMLYAAKYAEKDAIQFADLVRGLQAEPRKELTDLVRYMAKLALDLKMAGLSRDLNHVLAAIVDTADAWNNYAFMARESGQYENSAAAYRNALELEPDSGQLMNDLAVVLHYHIKTLAAGEEAEKLYKKALAAARKTLLATGMKAEKKAQARQAIQDATANLKDLKPKLLFLRELEKRKQKAKAKK